MNEKCVLIGGSGFLGVNLAKALLSSGYDVTLVDKKAPSQKLFSGVVDNISFRRIDFRDAAKIAPIIKDKDILFHFAYSSLPANSMRKMEEDLRSNVAESIGLFRLAAKNGVGKIVFPSSGGTVYGNTGMLAAKENFPTNPICAHGITKLTVEKYLFMFKEIFNLDYLIYRIANPYGPGQDPSGEQGLVANAMGKILKGLPVTVFGGGETVRDYIYVEDVIDAFTIGIKKDLKNDIFNIGTGKGYSINSAIRLIAKVAGVKPNIEYTSRRPFDVKASVLDNSKMRKASGWKPKVSFEKGIGKTYNWLTKHI